jgi:hypothetical protein
MIPASGPGGMGSFEFKIYFLIKFSNLKLTFANDSSKWPRGGMGSFLQNIRFSLSMSKETY